MIAIFSVYGLPIWFTILGIKRVASFMSWSAMKRLTSSIATASSTLPRVHSASQRLLHMRPQTAGNGFSFFISSSASVYPALRGKLQIALHGDVRGAGGLAGAVPVGITSSRFSR